MILPPKGSELKNIQMFGTTTSTEIYLSEISGALLFQRVGVCPSRVSQIDCNLERDINSNIANTAFLSRRTINKTFLQ
jgi:hypothetical protein